MKSLRWRLACWFSGGVVLVMVVFVAFTYRYLDAELRQKHWQRDYPDHPDWTLHGSYSEGEIQDILDELIETSLIYGLPLCLLAILIGSALAHKSLKPITNLNRQLKGIRRTDTLGAPQVVRAGSGFPDACSSHQRLARAPGKIVRRHERLRRDCGARTAHAAGHSPAQGGAGRRPHPAGSGGRTAQRAASTHAYRRPVTADRQGRARALGDSRERV